MNTGCVRFKKYGELTEADAALFFDTAVQNGGVDDDQATLIGTSLDEYPTATGRDRLMIIANAIAEGINPTYKHDALFRIGSQ